MCVVLNAEVRAEPSGGNWVDHRRQWPGKTCIKLVVVASALL
jgi:hypothetical protein